MHQVFQHVLSACVCVHWFVFPCPFVGKLTFFRMWLRYSYVLVHIRKYYAYADQLWIEKKKIKCISHATFNDANEHYSEVHTSIGRPESFFICYQKPYVIQVRKSHFISIISHSNEEGSSIFQTNALLAMAFDCWTRVPSRRLHTPTNTEIETKSEQVVGPDSVFACGTSGIRPHNTMKYTNDKSTMFGSEHNLLM